MTFENRYRALMEQAEPPEALQDDVLACLAELRNGSEPRAKNRRNVPKAAKVLAGALAAALLAGAVIAVPALLPAVPGSSGGTEAGAPDPSLADQFGLALYADAGEGGQTVQIITSEASIEPFGGEGGVRPTAFSYRVNLACVGEGIETVTYSLEGQDDVRFMLTELETMEDGTVHPTITTFATELTLDYANQQPEDLFRQIRVEVPTSEERDWFAHVTDVCARLEAASDPAERKALNDELTKLDREQAERNNAEYSALPQDDAAREAALDELFYEASCEAARKMGEAVLAVTATFDDGSTLTRRYRIAPVGNVEQVIADRMAAAREEGCLPDDPRLAAPLFEITELS